MSKKPNRDIPGDAVASAHQVTVYWFEVGVAMGDIDRYRDIDHLDAPTLLEIRVKCDPADDMGVLIVVKALSDDGPVVAFHRGESVVEAIQGASRRLKNHTLKWREDGYANSE